MEKPQLVGAERRRSRPEIQKRVATPAEAVRDGANYVVMGRQITRAADPAAEARAILGQISG